jgi:hypothetical protein
MTARAATPPSVAPIAAPMLGPGGVVGLSIAEGVLDVAVVVDSKLAVVAVEDNSFLARGDDTLHGANLTSI